MHVVQDIDGIAVARGVANEDSIGITLVAASGFASTGFYPAESIKIEGLTAIANLRQLCEELIEAHMQATQGDV